MPTLLLVAAAVFGVPVAAAVSARRGRLATVTIAGGRLVVHPIGVHRALAAGSGVDVAVGSVTAVRLADAWTVPAGVRTRGSFFRGALVAGTVGEGEDRAYWLVRKGRPAVVVDLAGEGYARLVVEVGDPRSVERAIRSALPHLPAASGPAGAERPLLRPLPPDLRL